MLPIRVCTTSSPIRERKRERERRRERKRKREKERERGADVYYSCSPLQKPLLLSFAATKYKIHP